MPLLSITSVPSNNCRGHSVYLEFPQGQGYRKYMRYSGSKGRNRPRDRHTGSLYVVGTQYSLFIYIKATYYIKERLIFPV